MDQRWLNEKMTVLKVKTVGQVRSGVLHNLTSHELVLCLRYGDDTEHSLVTPRLGDDGGLCPLWGGRNTSLHSSELSDYW